MMQIKHQHATLAYTRIGHGPKTMLGFHGFGQDCHCFDAIAASLSDTYTFYSFDLFFHGQSAWVFNKPLTKEFWAELVALFLARHQIERFSVMAYSFGGKPALATIEAFASQINEAVLIAPSGINDNFWLRLGSHESGFVDYLFKQMVHKPAILHQLTNLIYKSKLMSKSKKRFVLKQTHLPSQSLQVYQTWRLYRQMRFNETPIATLINEHRIQVKLLLGKHDKVITLKNWYSFADKIPDCKLLLLDAGHNDILRAVAKWFGKETAMKIASNLNLSKT